MLKTTNPHINIDKLLKDAKSSLAVADPVEPDILHGAQKFDDCFDELSNFIKAKDGAQLAIIQAMAHEIKSLNSRITFLENAERH